MVAERWLGLTHFRLNTLRESILGCFGSYWQPPLNPPEDAPMCRMLGVVSAQPRAFALLLEQAPHNMALLSEKHPDGWGIAVGQPEGSWKTHRSVQRALGDPDFHEFAMFARGDIIVVHVRQKTQGDIKLENTHPFESAPWVFTHNGTVKNTNYLRANISEYRRSRILGDTDSECLFAFLLTRIDTVLATNGAEHPDTEAALRAATRELAQVRELGTASFLLSNGRALYAHRLGAPLFLLQRGEASEFVCTECARNPCIAVTTEPLTDEDWLPLRDGDLVRISKDTHPTWTKL